MEVLYKEMQERLKLLESMNKTEEVQWRIAELTLNIVRVQQLLLEKIKKVDYCQCVNRSSFYRDKEDNDICRDCDLPINKI